MYFQPSATVVLWILYAKFHVSSTSCIQTLDGWEKVGLEERAKQAPIVFHGLAIEAININAPDDYHYNVQFWMINIYKGADAVAKLLNLDPGSGGVFNLRDRRINVTGFGDRQQCHPKVAPQKYYIIFCDVRNHQLVAKLDDLFGASAEWTEENEQRVWYGVGWNDWSDWGTCSASCGEGTQERIRSCRFTSNLCHGYNKERRRCNIFPCQGAVDPMRIEDRRFFHPSRGEWERVPGRPAAWRLRPNSYIWVPSSQIFPQTGSYQMGVFPREFALLVTLKLLPNKPAQGTVFSLRSRRQQNAYLSLELEKGDRVRVIHASANGTQEVVIPMKLNDGHWHQMGLALQDDNSVRSFLDCAWVSTDILKRNELDHPEDADLIIGYLFQGEIEQLIIVPDPRAVAQQCSSSRIPIYDPELEAIQPTTASSTTISEQKYTENFSSEEDVKQKPPKALSLVSDLQDDFEGSGQWINNASNYEVEWSDWSACSSVCGPGTQTRHSRCVDDGAQLELCMEAGGERTESRPCQGKCTEESNLLNSVYFHGKHGKPSIRNHTIIFRKKYSKHHKPPAARRRKHLSKGVKKALRERRRNNNVECYPGCMNSGFCSKPNKCTCTEHFTGPRCEIPICNPPCQNGGYCTHPNTCKCSLQTSGRYCEQFTCTPPCENGGECVGPGVCECPHNATGSACQHPLCVPPCENGASCAPGNTCLCSSNFTGVRCEQRKCNYEPVQEPYTKGFRRMVNRKIEKSCDFWSWRTCTTSVPEYQTVYKTFYRTAYRCKETKT